MSSAMYFWPLISKYIYPWVFGEEGVIGKGARLLATSETSQILYVIMLHVPHISFKIVMSQHATIGHYQT